MLIAILLATQVPTPERIGDPDVNLTVSVQEIVSQIAKATGQELMVAKELAMIPLYVHLSDRDIGSVAEPLAVLLDATWQSGTLKITDTVRDEYQDHWPEVISAFQSEVNRHLALLRSGVLLPKTDLDYPPTLPSFAASADEKTWQRFISGKVVAHEQNNRSNDLMLARTDGFYRYIQLRTLRGDSSSSSTSLLYGPTMSPKFDPASLLNSQSRLGERIGLTWHDAKFLKGLESSPTVRAYWFYSSEKLRAYNAIVDLPTLAFVTRRENSYRSPGVRLQPYYSISGDWLLLRPYNYIEQLSRHMGWPYEDAIYDADLSVQDQVSRFVDLSMKLNRARNYPITNLETLKYDNVVYSWPPGPYLDFWTVLTTEERDSLSRTTDMKDLSAKAQEALIDFVLFKVLMKHSTPSASAVRSFINDPNANVRVHYSAKSHYFIWDFLGIRYTYTSKRQWETALKYPNNLNGESAVWTEHKYDLLVDAIGIRHFGESSIHIPVSVDTRFTRAGIDVLKQRIK